LYLLLFRTWAGLPAFDRANPGSTDTSNDGECDRQMQYLFWKYLLRADSLILSLSGL
jgi:hypothetical protein